MKKYTVDTFYTCTFKIVHKLDELNEKKLSELGNRNDGEVQIIDVKLNNRKTKTTDTKDINEKSSKKYQVKKVPDISTIVNDKIINSDQLKTIDEFNNNDAVPQRFNKKTNERSKMPDRRKGYIQKITIGDHKIYIQENMMMEKLAKFLLI